LRWRLGCINFAPLSLRSLSKIAQFYRLIAIAIVAIKPERSTSVSAEIRRPTSISAGAASTAVVFATSSDPLETGLVASLARPGGNVTGLSTQIVDLATKSLELLREVIPDLARVAILFNAGAPTLAAVNSLKVKSCLIDGEAVVCDEQGLAAFNLLRRGGRVKHEAHLSLRLDRARRSGSAV
jgi:hypothetical protein